MKVALFIWLIQIIISITVLPIIITIIIFPFPCEKMGKEGPGNDVG